MRLTLERPEAPGSAEVWWDGDGDILLEKGLGGRYGMRNGQRADGEGDKDCTVKRIEE